MLGKKILKMTPPSIQKFDLEDPGEVSFFTRRGLPTIGGDQVLFLDQKGDQKIFF